MAVKKISSSMTCPENCIVLATIKYPPQMDKRFLHSTGGRGERAGSPCKAVERIGAWLGGKWAYLVWEMSLSTLLSERQWRVIPRDLTTTAALCHTTRYNARPLLHFRSRMSSATYHTSLSACNSYTNCLRFQLTKEKQLLG